MPSRIVVAADALQWMEENAPPPGASVVTSLPDVSEMSGMALEPWKAWFVEAARRAITWVPEDGVAIFFQSDIRHGGAWIDKGHLVHLAGDAAGATLLWHTIVCRKPPGTIALGRPSYSHMLCFVRGQGAGVHSHAPDVLPEAGAMPWSRAMGTEACRVACRYLVKATATRVVVDPFCGKGTVLAVANAMGLDAIGVDISEKRCKAARRCVV